MSQAPPSFLRLHRGPDANEIAASAQATAGQLAQSDAAVIDRLWDQFSAATGWRPAPRARRTGDAITLIPVVEPTSSELFGLKDLAGDSAVDALTQVTAVSKSAATDLANVTAGLVRQLTQSRQTIKRDQIELAARACVIASPDTRTQLVERIETILSDVVAACDVTAAIVYMLDDDTSQLAARSVFGMSSRVLDQPARSLKGSRGDLEAMVKGVVTIDDLNAGPIDTWNPPQPADAGICASICVADVPVGTLWLLSNETKQFGNTHAAAARMAARSIGVELSIVDSESPLLSSVSTSLDQLDAPSSRELQAIEASLEESALDEPVLNESELLELPEDLSDLFADIPEVGLDDLPAESTAKQDEDKEPLNERLPTADTHQAVAAIADVARWQIQTLPVGTALAPQWRVDGMIESPRDFAIGWHVWDVLPDGSLALAIAESYDQEIAGAMNAAVARAAFASHAGYRHTPAQMLSRVGDTLWQTTMDQQLTSMLYIRVDPESGEGEFASAGQISAIIGSRYGYRPVSNGPSPALCSQMESLSRQDSFRMMPGETFLAYTPGVLDQSATAPTRIGNTLHQAIRNSNRSPLAAIRQSLASIPMLKERGAATLMRSAPQ